MKKSILFGIFLLALMLSLGIATAANDTADFAQAKALIDSKVPCNQLSQDQLSMIGDYYMEQIHPGAAHDYMDQMMGGEGSQSLEQVHIAMAQRFYCANESGENYADYGYSPGYGMMGYGMGPGMMGGYAGSYPAGMMYGYDGQYVNQNPWLNGLVWITYIAIAGLVFGLVFWGTKRIMNGKARRK